MIGYQAGGSAGRTRGLWVHQARCQEEKAPYRSFQSGGGVRPPEIVPSGRGRDVPIRRLPARGATDNGNPFVAQRNADYGRQGGDV